METGLPELPHSLRGILRRMAPSGLPEHFLIQTLHPQLHRGNAHLLQQCENGAIDAVRPRRQTDALYPVFL